MGARNMGYTWVESDHTLELCSVPNLDLLEQGQEGQLQAVEGVC